MPNGIATPGLHDFASMLEGGPPAPSPAGARLVKQLADDDPEPTKGGVCRECGGPTKYENSKVCRPCYESKAAARKPRRTDQPQQQPGEETAMPRGVYDRSKSKRAKKEPEGGVAEKKTRRRKAANGEGGDVAALATEQLIAAGQLLRAAVEDSVELEGGDSVLRGALANYDRAQKLREAAGG